MNKEYFEVNLKRWNELVSFHAKSKQYDLENFIMGKTSLKTLELEELGDVTGKTMLHLQCHFGLDSLSWARMGAKVTGVDFAPEAVKLASELAEKLQLEAKFVEANIYDLPDVLNEKFDIVFTSYGVLCWLPDMKKWAEVIAHFLKEGGIFYIAEFHPFAYVFDDENEKELAVRYDYFSASEPLKFDEEGSYASDAQMENTVTYEWTHSLSDIVNALLQAGLQLEFLNEHPITCFRQFPFTAKDEDGWYRLKNQKVTIPLVFSIRASKK